MQVDVIQAKDVTFKKWQWWSDWVDICVFTHSYEAYLLQMSVSRTNAKKFKHRALHGCSLTVYCHQSDIKSLTQMKKET